MANLLLNVKDIKWNYCLQEVSGGYMHSADGTGPCSPLPMAHSSRCSSIGTDPKVTTEDAQQSGDLCATHAASPGQGLPMVLLSQ